VERNARGWCANRNFGRHGAGLARPIDRCRCDLVRLLPAGERITELLLSFTLPKSAAARVLLFIAGALSVGLAIFYFRHFGEGYAVLLLSLCTGVGITLLGVSEVAVAGGLPELAGRGWYMVPGILSVIAGVIVLIWPFDSIVLLAIVTDTYLVLIGVVQIVQAFHIRKEAKPARQTLDALAERVAA
jgi:Short repeat of unknown function (DUF308)